jgi:hypothetical protein
MIDISIRPRTYSFTPERLQALGLDEIAVSAHAVCEIVDDRKWLSNQIDLGKIDAKDQLLWEEAFIRRNREIWGAYSHG